MKKGRTSDGWGTKKKNPLNWTKYPDPDFFSRGDNADFTFGSQIAPSQPSLRPARTVLSFSHVSAAADFCCFTNFRENNNVNGPSLDQSFLLLDLSLSLKKLDQKWCVRAVGQ
jgi:hypothetical protein